jgi:hypothetical protein
MQLGGFRERFLLRTRNAGFTMAEAVIAVGILGIMVYTGLGMWKNIDGLKAKLNVESDRIDIGLALRERIDCVKTMAAFSPTTVCDSATASSPIAVALRDTTDQIIVASGEFSSTIITSSYQAKASCYKDGPYYVMNTSIIPSSQTGQNIKVFKNIGYLCWPAASPPPPPPPSAPPPPSGSCFSMGETDPIASCAACDGATLSCYYAGNTEASFRLFDETAGCSGLVCPGSPTMTRCMVTACAGPLL